MEASRTMQRADGKPRTGNEKMEPDEIRKTSEELEKLLKEYEERDALDQYYDLEAVTASEEDYDAEEAVTAEEDYDPEEAAVSEGDYDPEETGAPEEEYVPEENGGEEVYGPEAAAEGDGAAPVPAAGRPAGSAGRQGRPAQVS